MIDDPETEDPWLKAVAASPSVPPRSSIPERYEVSTVLGRGGFGIVYDAYDRVREERVALKVLRHLAPETLLHLKAEFRAVSEVRNPHLIRLYDLTQHDGGVCLSMRLVDDARTFLDAARASEATLRRVLAQTLDGLNALHDAGLVHQDIKPTNVLVDRDDHVYLVDFGLASTPRSRPSGGTPHYMAPDRVTTPSVDAYALGVMLFRALTGRFPYTGDAREVREAQRSRRAPTVRSLAPDAPWDLARLVDSLLLPYGERPTLRALKTLRRSSTLVGREPELDFLRSAIHEHRLIEVIGSSGIGKSALLDAFAERIRRDGDLVLRARCHPRESLPFRAIDAIVDAIATHLGEGSLEARVHPSVARLFPVLTPFVTSSLGSCSGLSGLRLLFEEIAAQARIVLLVDDLHWADAESADALIELLRTPEIHGLSIVSARRPADEPSFRERIDKAVRVGLLRQPVELPLRRLDLRAARELAISLGQPGRIPEILEDADGDPFLIKELVTRGGRLESTLALRLSRLDPEVRHAVELLAIGGPPLTEEVLVRLFGASVVDALLASPIARIAPEGVQLAHDRVTELVLDQLKPARERALHAELAEAYVGLGAPAARIATHLDRAGDPRAPRALLDAIEAAERLDAFPNATWLYARLAKWEGDASIPLDPATLRARWASACARGGQPKRASALYLEASSRVRDDRRLRWRVDAAHQAALATEADRAEALCREALAFAGARTPTHPLRLAAQVAVDVGRSAWRSRFARRSLDRKRARRLEHLWQVFGALAVSRPLGAITIATAYYREAATADALHRLRAVGMRVFVESLLRANRGYEARRVALREAARGVTTPEGLVTARFFEAANETYSYHFEAGIRAARDVIELAPSVLGWGFEAMTTFNLLGTSLAILERVDEFRNLAAHLMSLGVRLDHPMARQFADMMGAFTAQAAGTPAPSGWHADTRDDFAALVRDVNDVAMEAIQGRVPSEEALGASRRALKAFRFSRFFRSAFAALCMTPGELAAAKAGDRVARRNLLAVRSTLRRGAGVFPRLWGTRLDLALADLDGREDDARRLLELLARTPTHHAALTPHFARRRLALLHGDDDARLQAEEALGARGVVDPARAVRFVLPGTGEPLPVG